MASVIVALAGGRESWPRPRVQEVFQRLTGTVFVVIVTRLATASR